MSFPRTAASVLAGSHRRHRDIGLLIVVGAIIVTIVTSVEADQRRGGRLELTVVDRDTGEVIPCRMHLTRVSSGKPHRVPRVPFWHDHFVFPGQMVLELPRGKYTFEVERGPEYVINTGYFTIEDFADDSKRIELQRAANMVAEGWWSGDLHVERDTDDIELLMQAEELYVAALVESVRGTRRKTASPLPAFVLFDDERYYLPRGLQDPRAGGALLALGASEEWRDPLADAPRPWTIETLREARRRGAWIDVSRPTARSLPVWLAAGVVDSIELVHADFARRRTMDEPREAYTRDRKRYPGMAGMGRWSQDIYYHVLNAGLRIPPSAGSASGVEPNPLGYNRLYVHVGGDFDLAGWWDAFRAGRVVVTNGPLLRPFVAGRLPGHTFQASPGETLQLAVNLNLTIRDRVSYLEIIKNGFVEQTVRLEDYAATGTLPPLEFTESGWFLIRAVTDVETTYRFASTAPYYVEFSDAPERISQHSVQFFLDWLDQLDSGAEEEAALDEARSFWQQRLEAANCP